MIGNRHLERDHPGVIRSALRENRLVIFRLCSIRLRRHGPFISCHIFVPLCFALSGTHLGSSFFSCAILEINDIYRKPLAKDVFDATASNNNFFPFEPYEFTSFTIATTCCHHIFHPNQQKLPKSLGLFLHSNSGAQKQPPSRRFRRWYTTSAKMR